jgi:hypothetical protein
MYYSILYIYLYVYYIYVYVCIIYILLTPDCNIVITSMSHDAMSNQPWPTMTSHENSDISMWRYIWNFIYLCMYVYIYICNAYTYIYRYRLVWNHIYIENIFHIHVIQLYASYITKELYLPMKHFLISASFRPWVRLRAVKTRPSEMDIMVRSD